MTLCLVLLLLAFPIPSQADTEPSPPPVLEKAFQKVCSRTKLKDNRTVLVVVISEQRLYLLDAEGKVQRKYPVSTSHYGVGNKSNSNKTPLGSHAVKEKYGEGAPRGTIFTARKNTGKVAEIHTDETKADDDLVTTRILWLAGKEPGINQGKGIDSYQRYIYIHGTPEEGLIGKPASHGCIRMRNDDVIELFDRVPVGTWVEIVE